MKAYSDDLRLRVIKAIQANQETQDEIAARFAISTSFLEKLWRRWRETGDYKALLHGGGRARACKDEAGLIRALVARQPDATLAELTAQVAQEMARRKSRWKRCGRSCRGWDCREKKDILRFGKRIRAGAGKPC